MKVGFIGLGIMGKSMAANLQKSGHELVVHDLKRDAAAPHIQAGAVWADTPRKVAEATEIVFTSLPGPPDMESVALGEQGLLSGLQKGKAYFDLTTNSPTVVRKVHAVFADKQARDLGRRR
jgi:3-hydroxyisobutyrate dehydrogenase